MKEIVNIQIQIFQENGKRTVKVTAELSGEADSQLSDLVHNVLSNFNQN